MDNEIILNVSQNTFNEIIKESAKYCLDYSYVVTPVRCENLKVKDCKQAFTLGNVTFIENLEEKI